MQSLSLEEELQFQLRNMRPPQQSMPPVKKVHVITAVLNEYVLLQVVQPRAAVSLLYILVGIFSQSVIT